MSDITVKEMVKKAKIGLDEPISARPAARLTKITPIHASI